MPWRRVERLDTKDGIQPFHRSDAEHHQESFRLGAIGVERRV
jgi:hypothetical protein